MRLHRLARVQHVYHHEVESPAEPPTPQISAKVDGKGQIEVSVWNCSSPDELARLVLEARAKVKAALEQETVKPAA